MSTMQRTVDNFPRMKVRGGTRRHGNRQPRDPYAALIRFAEIASAARIAFVSWAEQYEAFSAKMTESLMRLQALNEGAAVLELTTQEATP